MITVNAKHIMVFAVNILSPRNVQVNIGNIINPAQEAINLADHAEPVVSTTSLHPYQNMTEVGTPMITADSSALSFQ